MIFGIFNVDNLCHRLAKISYGAITGRSNTVRINETGLILAMFQVIKLLYIFFIFKSLVTDYIS